MTHRTAVKAAERKKTAPKSQITAPKQRGRPFEHGADPRRNLGGRPQAKEANQLIAAIWDEAIKDRTRGELLIRELFALAEHRDPEIRLRAIKEVLDRRLGKPMQTVMNLLPPSPIKVAYV